MSDATLQDGKIVGAVAVYKTPDDLAEGLRRAREHGFRRLDAVMPYPIHGIDHLLDRKPSKLGIVALIAGLTGTALAKSFQWWASAIDYPLNIGGKPLFSWQAFMPVTFEFMVLFTAIMTTIGMIAIFNRLPSYNSALLASKFMPELTTDKFGVVVDAHDPMFDTETIRSVLGGDGSIGIDLLYAQPERSAPITRTGSPGFVILLAVLAIGAIITTRIVVRYTGEIPPWNAMKYQSRLNSQAVSSVFLDGFGMRPPVEGTVARDHLPYAYANDPEAAAENLVNTIPLTTENLERGKDQYGAYCLPCHGVLGDGRMTLTSAYPKPPTLHSNKVRDWSDGRIYHVIMTGQNAMPSYASQIRETDRWRIIHYVRALQRSRNAPERDVQ
jgi:mono/diheme cytochrome c family protein